MKYAICYNPDIKSSLETKKTLEDILKFKNISFNVVSIDSLEFGYDFVFVIGGDGTILKSAKFYAPKKVPVLGINLGRLGFLSQVSISELESAVCKILNGEFKIENRIMLESQSYIALNDFVVKGEDTSRLSGFIVKIGDKVVCEYPADGIIISTPTGSTAYGMAAGGPILSPDVDNIVIVPICPHTFSARPIVVNADKEITILGANGASYCVSADGQPVFTFKDSFTVRKSKNCANLALLKENDFYTVLRNKLNWGISSTKF